MKFRKNHAKRVLGGTAMRAKPWDNTSKHAANTAALARATGWSRSDDFAVRGSDDAKQPHASFKVGDTTSFDENK